METQVLCQSCGMPLDDQEMLGTEQDGSQSEEYCLNCYVEGSFRDADMTLDEMREIVIAEMEKMQESPDKIDKAIKNLDDLKRWKN